MEEMTAEQAAAAAKGLTFETVWAALMETRKNQEESYKQMQEYQRESQKRMEASHRETQRELRESQRELRESQKKTDKIIADLSKNIGGLGNSLGRFIEDMFSAELWEKFSKLGFAFTRQSPHIKFIENERVFAEVDVFLENGVYAMLVEVKTVLATDDIDDHLARIEKIRRYLDARGDKRKLIGAVAGGVISESVLNYAQKNGLYAITQSGDSVEIASTPQGFKAREW